MVRARLRGLTMPSRQTSVCEARVAIAHVGQLVIARGRRWRGGKERVRTLPPSTSQRPPSSAVVPNTLVLDGTTPSPRFQRRTTFSSGRAGWADEMEISKVPARSGEEGSVGARRGADTPGAMRDDAQPVSLSLTRVLKRTPDCSSIPPTKLELSAEPGPADDDDDAGAIVKSISRKRPSGGMNDSVPSFS